jgi:hypothetical protein
MVGEVLDHLLTGLEVVQVVVAAGEQAATTSTAWDAWDGGMAVITTACTGRATTAGRGWAGAGTEGVGWMADDSGRAYQPRLGRVSRPDLTHSVSLICAARLSMPAVPMIADVQVDDRTHPEAQFPL